MKSLKEYINEGLLDRVKNKEVSHEILIEEFLKDNYKIDGPYAIKTTDKGFVVDVRGGDIEVKNENITSLTNGLFEFGVVSRKFDCSCCKSLKSLEGAPQKVGQSFYCIRCESLKTLEGAPQKVSNDFTCGSCTSLISLKGAPKEIDGNFYCSGCKSLKSLEGAPESCRGFYCNNCGVKFEKEDVKKYTTVARDIDISV